MYKLMVKEITASRKQEAVLFSAHCRISALSSADFCLGKRRESDQGSFFWRAKAPDICRLLEAERMGSGFLDSLEEGKEYAVFFIQCVPACA